MSFLGIIGKKTKTIERTGFQPLLGEPANTFKKVIINSIVNDIDIDEAIIDAQKIKNPVSTKEAEFQTQLSMVALTKKSIDQAAARFGIQSVKEYYVGKIETISDVVTKYFEQQGVVHNPIGITYQVEWITGHYVDGTVVEAEPSAIKVDGEAIEVHYRCKVEYSYINYRQKEITEYKYIDIYVILLDQKELLKGDLVAVVDNDDNVHVFRADKFFANDQDVASRINKCIPIINNAEWTGKRYILERAGISNSKEFEEQLKNKGIEFAMLGTFLSWKLNSDDEKYIKEFDKLWFKALDYFVPDTTEETKFSFYYKNANGNILYWYGKGKVRYDDLITEYSRTTQSYTTQNYVMRPRNNEVVTKVVVRGEGKEVIYEPVRIVIAATEQEKENVEKYLLSGIIDEDNEKLAKIQAGYELGSADVFFRFDEDRFFIPLPDKIVNEMKTKIFLDMYPALFGMIYHTKQTVTYTTVFGMKMEKLFKLISIAITFLSAGTLPPLEAFIATVSGMALEAGVFKGDMELVVEVATAIYFGYESIQSSSMTTAQKAMSIVNTALNIYDSFVKLQLQMMYQDFLKFKEDVQREIEKYKDEKNYVDIIIREANKANYEPFYTFATDVAFLQELIFDKLMPEEGLPDVYQLAEA